MREKNTYFDTKKGPDLVLISGFLTGDLLPEGENQLVDTISVDKLKRLHEF